MYNILVYTNIYIYLLIILILNLCLCVLYTSLCISVVFHLHPASFVIITCILLILLITFQPHTARYPRGADNPHNRRAIEECRAVPAVQASQHCLRGSHQPPVHAQRPVDPRHSSDEQAL